jgi:peptide/nickel transport system permease protein
MTMETKRTKKQLKAEKRTRKQRQEWEKLHKSSNAWTRFFNNLRMSFFILYRNKKAFIGFIILVIFLFMAAVGPFIIKLDQTVNYDARYQMPSWSHPLGTDFTGIDIFAQVVHGSRDVLTVAAIAAVLTILIGFVMGAAAGFIGGWVDVALSFIAKTILTLPQTPVFMILAVRLDINNVFVFAAILSIFTWAGLAMQIRAQILSLKERDFMLCDRMMGMSRRYIIFKEILPNITSYLAINFVMTMYNAILMSVGLMLLGIVTYKSTNWGAMINLAKAANGGLVSTKGYLNIFAPIAVMGLFQMACIFFSSGLEEIINPRLREN